MRVEAADIKARVHMPDLLPTDRKLVKSGRDSYRTTCPIHGGERLSFGIKRMPDGDWHFNCWACGEKGDVFALVMALERCTFRQALDRLAKDVAPLLGGPPPKRPRHVPKWLMVCDTRGCGATKEVEAGAEWAIERQWPRGGWELRAGKFYCGLCLRLESLRVRGEFQLFTREMLQLWNESQVAAHRGRFEARNVGAQVVPF